MTRSAFAGVWRFCRVAAAVGAVLAPATSSDARAATADYQRVASFAGTPNDQGVPLGGVIQDLQTPTLYGIASGARGDSGYGAIYQVDANGNYKTLYTFAAPDSEGCNTTGFEPQSRPLETQGELLYGSCEYGGANGTGTLYRYNIATGRLRILHTFASVDASGVNSDGADPVGALVRGTDSMLYGVAAAGGQSGYGDVFRLDPSTGAFVVIHVFGGTAMGDGASPASGLSVKYDGGIFGTTSQGGKFGDGTVFRMGYDSRTASYTYNVRYSFDGNDGRYPDAPLTLVGNVAYTSTYYGGGNDLGTLIELTDGGRQVSVLHSFTGASDGNHPTGGVLDIPTDEVIGTASAGGALNFGEIYAYGASGFRIEHSFRGPDGAHPEGQLTLARDGTVYGTTTAGGVSGFGVLYALTHY